MPSRCRSPWTSVRRSRDTARVLLVFLDGVGIGRADPAVNPFFRARLPALSALLGGEPPALDRSSRRGPGAVAFPLSATLDVPGTPQSGTGQAALLTGASAAEIHGRHFGPWTPVRLRALVEERSLLRRAADAGRSVAFANAYPRGWPGDRGGRRIAGPPLAARGAGVLNRHEEHLASGDAVSSEIVNDGWRQHLGHGGLPDVTPQEAGRHLARISEKHELTCWAHYATDTAGHRGEMSGAVTALERVDAFLSGVLEACPPDTLVLLVSDHGNIEDVRVGHTLNPALGVAAGTAPGLIADAADSLRDIRDVTPFLLDLLDVGD